jgi:hypothetical protein
MVFCASDMLVLKFPIITSTSAAVHAVITVFICSLIFTRSYCVFLLCQQAALVLNASRRFRYTLDLKKEEEKEQIRRKIRAHAQVIRVFILSYVPGIHVYTMLHLLCLMDLSLNAIRPLYFSKRLGKSRLMKQSYQVTVLDNICLLVFGFTESTSVNILVVIISDICSHGKHLCQGLIATNLRT